MGGSSGALLSIMNRSRFCARAKARLCIPADKFLHKGHFPQALAQLVVGT